MTDEPGVEFHDFLTLPPTLVGATTRTLTARYFDLAETKLALQTRAGCHPSGFNDPSVVESDKDKREALRVSLQSVVREMTAIQYEISKRPNALLSGVPLGLWRGK